MSVDDPHNSHRGGTKGDLGRAERLAAQLRENLKRRKARARGREASNDPPGQPGEVASETSARRTGQLPQDD